MEHEHFEALYPDTTREAEIEKLIGFVKEGSSCQLVSMPGVGRSTVLGLLSYNKHIQTKHLGQARKSTHFVMVNFSEIRKRPLFDAMKFLFLSLAESLRDRGMDEEYRTINELFKESLGFGDELVLFQGLKQAVSYLALEKKLTIVFLFDRFEEYIPTVTAEFFINLRILRNKAKYRFSVVFSLNRPLEDVLDPSMLADYYEFVAGHIVYLPLFNQIATDFRISYIEKITGKKLSKAQLEQIRAVTGGHGKLMKLAVESLLAHEEAPKDLQEFLFSYRSIKGALSEIWMSLSPAEQADLLQNTFDDPTTAVYLQDIGLIADNKMQIPLFAEFVTSEGGQVGLKEAIVYDQHTNTIRKGAIVLSDQLTSSEFRLLRYLLQNQEKIIERDELISVVWQGMKSTAGITDQAVDQLVFRLRRKIEEDANNPLHLLTVKGRGFKFAP